MHPIDSTIALLLGIGFLIFFVLAIKQISGFVFKCIWYTFVMGLIIFALLIVYRIAGSLLFYYVITPVFDVELITISLFLNESLIINYALGLIDSFIELSHLKIISNAWVYVKTMWSQSQAV